MKSFLVGHKTEATSSAKVARPLASVSFSMRTTFVVLAMVWAVSAVAEPPGYWPMVPLFNCTALPTPPPATDVRQLRFGNIKVAMGLGDSISAGFAEKAGRFWDFWELVEYRGSAWMMGGDDGEVTVGNFLKHYNPGLVGLSKGRSWPLDALKWQNHIVQPWDVPVTRLNAAQSMARLEAIPSQIDYLVDQLKTTYKQKVDMNNDWKMITLFIGANNLCAVCESETKYTAAWFESNLQAALTQIHDDIPRVWVNLVAMFNISQVYDLAMTSDYCYAMWDTILGGECPCMTKLSRPPSARQKMDEMSVQYNEVMHRLAKQWQSKNEKEFNVVVQPFLTNMMIPKRIGLKILSEFDCFHPNALAHSAFAIGMWNNLQQPQGKKQESLDTWHMEMSCPTEDTFIQ